MNARSFLWLPLLALFSSLAIPACGGSGGATDCDDGKTFQEPAGCAPDATTPILAGCYASCTTPGAACPGGTCQNAFVNPCRCESAEGCCDACSGEMLLCVP